MASKIERRGQSACLPCGCSVQGAYWGQPPAGCLNSSPRHPPSSCQPSLVDLSLGTTTAYTAGDAQMEVTGCWSAGEHKCKSGWDPLVAGPHHPGGHTVLDMGRHFWGHAACRQ